MSFFKKIRLHPFSLSVTIIILHNLTVLGNQVVGRPQFNSVFGTE
jgi:hypothetical protein